jgi:hypothetical protein
MRWYACLRKRTYLTWQDVERALRSLQQRAGPAHRLNSYRCDFCTAFHLGHVPEWARKGVG